MLSALKELLLLPIKLVVILLELLGRTLGIIIGLALVGIGALFCSMGILIILGAPLCLLGVLMVVKAID